MLFPRLKKNSDSQRGFTIIELLIFSAIFSIMAISFLSVLVSSVQIQAKQNATAEVTQQSQLLLDTIQYYVQSASEVETPADTATTTLKLRMASSTIDPTYIYLSGNTVYLQQTDAGAAQALTSDKVNVSNLAFTKRANSPGHDSVSVGFTIAYNSSSSEQSFLQSLNLSVARVGAATFDSNITPGSNNTYTLGSVAQDWKAINSTIYFSGSNVGIGVSTPGQTLEVNGGIRLNTTIAQPTCASAQRGTFWVVESGSGVKDYVQVCVKNASDTYMWATIY
ncbi:MAG TPA: type II secretion system protein [Candidatus Paceibacterota bacterium]|nr:type II secretion system protein [Candidatus Paceibacterota bacterium]